MHCLSHPPRHGGDPKVNNPERIVENLKSAELKLDAEDMKRLKALNRKYRTIPGDYFMKTGESLDDFWDVHADKLRILL